MRKEEIEEMKISLKILLEAVDINYKMRTGKNTVKIAFEDESQVATEFITALLVRNYRTEIHLKQKDVIEVYMRNLDKPDYEPESFIELLYMAIGEIYSDRIEEFKKLQAASEEAGVENVEDKLNKVLDKAITGYNKAVSDVDSNTDELDVEELLEDESEKESS